MLKSRSLIGFTGHRAGYQKMRPSAMWWWSFTGTISTWSATLAPVFVLLALLNKLSKYWHDGGWALDKHFDSWLLVAFLPIALPLLAGVASGLRHVLDAGRRKDRYPQMVACLNHLKAALPGLQTTSTIQTAVSRSEELLLDELQEWQLAMKNTGY